MKKKCLFLSRENRTNEPTALPRSVDVVTRVPNAKYKDVSWFAWFSWMVFIVLFDFIGLCFYSYGLIVLLSCNISVLIYVDESSAGH